MTAIDKLRALLDDHERRYGRGDLWRAASEALDEMQDRADRLEKITLECEFCAGSGDGPNEYINQSPYCRACAGTGRIRRFEKS